MFYKIFLDAVGDFRSVPDGLGEFVLEVVRDPRVVEKLFYAWSFCLIPIKTLHNEILSLTRYIIPVLLRRIPEFHFLMYNIVVNFLDTPALKRRSAA